jgi:hypothetical protein
MLPALLQAILPKALEVLDEVIPDRDAADQARQNIEAKLVEAMMATNVAQIETNTAEAQSRHWFVASWRPAIGWSCAIGVFWMAVGAPLIQFFAAMGGVEMGEVPTVPEDMILELTFAMLGMAGLRTFEKLRGVTQ